MFIFGAGNGTQELIHVKHLLTTELHPSLWVLFEPYIMDSERQVCFYLQLSDEANNTTFSLSSTVKSCLDLLVNWLHMYLNNQDSGTKAFCDVALHGPFYSACQAVFYTFVFRYKQLLSGNLKEG